MSISAVILAAGESSRMGEPKPLLQIKGKSFLERAVGNCQQAGIGEILVVLGHSADGMIPHISELGCQWIIHSNYSEGQTSSLQAGLRAIRQDVEAFLLYPIDYALVEAQDLRLLLQAREQYPTKAAYIPVFQNQKGHPVLLDHRIREKILEISADLGANVIVRQFQKETILIPVENEWVLRDIDTPADLESARRST